MNSRVATWRWLILGGFCVGIGMLRLSVAAEPVATDDPLLRALQELRREVDLLKQERVNRPPAPMQKSPPATALPPASPSVTNPSGRPPVPRTPQLSAVVAPNVPAPLATSPAVVLSNSDHWAFQPVVAPKIPQPQSAAWPRTDIDRFIADRWEAAGLQPAPDADRYTLLRRLSLDLTGLPPEIGEIQQFVSDPAPLEIALAHWVDRYLESPRFGERWGRHWLDVVRYSDSVGRTWNAPFTYAWLYRNWVIDAFNADLSYQSFLQQQIAGDLLPAASLAARRQQVIATTVLALGSLDLPDSESEQFRLDRIDDQIDVITRGFLAITVSCARCHDHKADPVSMSAYYALAGIFASTETHSGQRRGDYVATDRLLRVPDEQGRPAPRDFTPGLHSMADIVQEQRAGGYRDLPFAFDPHFAMGLQEGEPTDCAIRIGGRPRDLGDTPPRGDFHLPGFPALDAVPASDSGRLQLAAWVTSRNNPLTARVMVNRVWLHLLGAPLVSAVDNFGTTTAPPTHPELLDHLATRFMVEGWSLKQLIRVICLSRVYRLSSQSVAANAAIDPQNLWYWRGHIQRLELEPLRDSLLLAAGRLSSERPAGIPMSGVGGKGRWGTLRTHLTVESPYRTVYLPVFRSQLPEMYHTFDFPDPAQIQSRRETTTVATQSLFLLNSQFVVDCADDVAEQILSPSKLTAEARVELVYWKLFSRPPRPAETQAALQWLAELEVPSDARDGERFRWATWVQALFASAEFRSRL